MRVALIIALASVAVAMSAAAEDASRKSPPATRDALWRSIFARPSTVPHPDHNPGTPEKIALGRDLFHDPRLSGKGERSCASCHNPAQGFSNGEPRGIGLDGKPLKRNVPALYSLAWGTSFYWDGRAPSLEEQARIPVTAANEMGGNFSAIVAELSADAALAARFAQAFPESPVVSEEAILKAIGAYERTLAAPRTRFDDWVEGADAALTAEEKSGFAIFAGKGGCVACHGGWRFTDDAFHDIGLASDDPGRGAVEGGVPGLAQFKTPSLRESLHSAPYMHDGSMATLEKVVEHYAGGLMMRPSLAASIRRDLRLSPEEKRALISFLATLSSSVPSEKK